MYFNSDICFYSDTWCELIRFYPSLLVRAITASASASAARTPAPAPMFAFPIPRARPGTITTGSLPFAPISVTVAVPIAITSVPPVTPIPIPVATPARFPPLILLPADLIFDVLLHAPDEGHGHRLDVHKVAKPAAAATALVVIATTRLTKVRHRAELHLQLPSVVVTAIEHVEGVSGLLFVKELAVDVTDHVISEVVAHR